MKNYKFIQLVKTFHKKELVEFYDFIRSPYFNKTRDYSEIYKVLKRYTENWKEFEKLSPKDFYTKAFADKSYNNKTLRNRFTELMKLGEKFVIQKKLNENEGIRAKFLFEGYLDKKLDRLFDSEFRKVSNKYENRHLDSYEMSEIYSLHSNLLLQKRKIEEAYRDYKKYTDFQLGLMLERLFVIEQEYAIQKSYNINPEVNLADDIIANLDEEKLIATFESRNDPAYLRIIINYFVYKSLSFIKEEMYFNKLKSVFLKNLEMLSEGEKTNIFTMMNNYCIIKINSGQNEYLDTVFELLNIKLESGLYSELNEMRYPSVAFRDYVIFGVKLKKFDWVQEFISKYSKEMPKEIREEETFMAYARLYFYKGNFQRALEILRKLKALNYLANLDAYRLKMMIYYEIPDFEEAFMEIDRAKHYLKNNLRKIPKPIRAYTKEFLQKYLALLKLKLNPNKSETDYLAHKINASPNIPSRDWFKEKVNEIGKYT